MKPTAFHQPRMNPRPTLVIDLTRAADFGPDVARSVRLTANNRGCPCHLFIAPEGAVYLIPDTHPAAQTWPMERFAWYVGCYGNVWRDDRLLLRADSAGIAEDIADHAAGLLRIAASVRA